MNLYFPVAMLEVLGEKSWGVSDMCQEPSVDPVLHEENFHFWYFKYILMLILLYCMNAWLVQESFYIVLLLLLHKLIN